jgi:sucrose-6-phosphate hydrolase SacC (GH32 family)
MTHIPVERSIMRYTLYSSVGTALFLCAFLASATAENFPRELVAFGPAPGNPIFTARGEGHWDVKIRERGWILFNADASDDVPAWQMWFTGYDGTRDGKKQLGYATSDDGISWERHPKNPIYSEHWVEDMMVVRHKGTLYMFAEGARDQAHLLTSKDGIKWTRKGPLDVRTANGHPIESGPYGTPAAWFEKGKWHLFYERRDLGIWLATSEDMKVWRNVQDEPVLSPGPEEYDRDLVALNQIVRYKGRYYAYFHGSKRGSGLWSTAIAVSDDLIRWKKYPQNPLFPISENKSSGILVHDGRQFRLYTMHNEVHLHAVIGPGTR